MLAQCFLVDVEDARVAVDMAGHRPAFREIGADDLGELLGGVVAVPVSEDSAAMVRVASVSRYGKDRSMLPIHGEPSTQILMPT